MKFSSQIKVSLIFKNHHYNSPLNKLKKKNHMIISMDKENHLTIPCPLMIKILIKVRTERNFLKSPTVNIVNNNEKQCFLFMTWNRVKTYCPNSTIQNFNEDFCAVRGKERRNKRQIEW